MVTVGWAITRPIRGPANAPPMNAAAMVARATITAPITVLPLPLFDARKEAEKWW
jgi:hypothetical protein